MKKLMTAIVLLVATIGLAEYRPSVNNEVSIDTKIAAEEAEIMALVAAQAAQIEVWTEDINPAALKNGEIKMLCDGVVVTFGAMGGTIAIEDGLIKFTEDVNDLSDAKGITVWFSKPLRASDVWVVPNSDEVPEVRVYLEKLVPYGVARQIYRVEYYQYAATGDNEYFSFSYGPPSITWLLVEHADIQFGFFAD